MSAIYQRARPIRWDQVVGQEHVKDVLGAALAQGRVGHAYLFSGPRGVGKTTTARLIAMTANCTQPGVKPCGECESCLSVRAGNHPDVLEIDAASNNSVDDVRELREKVGLSAMRGGKKIYILDEAHMMSRAAFNALLKTLEEPPEHVIFILATTEPEKIIPTILSRCQHYRFRRLTPEEIAGKLAGIAVKEGVNAEPEALQLIGRLADGAMRDGESLLERMLATGTDVTRAGVEAALGLPPGEQMRSMAASLVQNDAGGLLEGAASLYRAGYAARTVVEGLVTALGQALHAELGIEGAGSGRLEGADVPRLLRLQAALDAQDSRFARGADLQSLELALTHALLAGDGNTGGGSSASAANNAGSGGAGLGSADVTQRLARLEKELRDLKSGSVPVAARPMAQPVTSALDEIPAFDAASRSPATRPAPVPVEPAAQGNWADVVRLTSPQTRAFLKPARMHAQQGYVSLSYDDKSSFHAKQVISKFEELGRVVVQVFGPVMLEIMGPTPDSSRKAQVGGKGSSQQGGNDSPPPVAPAPQPTPPVPVAAAATPAPQTPMPQAVDEIAPSKDVPAAAPAREPAPVAVPLSAVSPAASLDASLDDRAPAPLPAPQASVQQHAADVPPLPAGSGPPGTRMGSVQADQIQPNEVQPPRETRATYIEPQPIFEEPDWDDLGTSPDLAPATQASSLPRQMAVVDMAGQDLFNGLVVQVEAADLTPPSPVPALEAVLSPPAPTVRPAVATSTAKLEDLRAHPLYQDATRRWAGRVKEVGKVKPVVREEVAGLPGDEVLAEEESA